MMLDLWIPYMLMFVSMTFTLIQGGSAKAKNQHCMLLANKQAINIKLATTVGHFLCDLDLAFASVYMACPACYYYYYGFVILQGGLRDNIYIQDGLAESLFMSGQYSQAAVSYQRVFIVRHIPFLLLICCLCRDYFYQLLL